MVSAIIVAAGKSARMGPGQDKLFMEIAGRPVIAHTWQRFDSAQSVDEIIMVVREGMERAVAELAERFRFRKPFRVVRGGVERQDSVWNGLESLSAASEIAAIQDGARPCASETLINATIAAAREVGAAVAAQRVTDTIKEAADGRLISPPPHRGGPLGGEKPQTFRREVIRRALAAVRAQGLRVTDDTAACELIGQPVKLVENRAANPKVTVPADLHCIELLLKSPGG